MRIVQVANFSGFAGGGEHSLVDLSTGLAARGHDLLVAVPAEGTVAAAARDAGLDVAVVPIPRIRGFGILFLPASGAAFRRLFGRFRPDVVATGGARGVIAAAAAARLVRAPLVWHARVAASDPLDPILLRLADAVVANSRATAERFAGSPERLRRRVRVIPNGIPIQRIARGAAAREAARAALGLPTDAEVVGCVGRFTEEKGQDLLARAAAALLAERPRLRLVFVGDTATPFGARVLAALPPGPRVLYAGARADLGELFVAFDALAVPSRTEGFGRVVAEAFAAEVAVVATDAGGLPETVGAAGVLVPANDPDRLAAALREVLDAPTLRETLARAGRWRAEAEFSIEACVESVEAAYREAAGRS